MILQKQSLIIRFGGTICASVFPKNSHDPTVHLCSSTVVTIVISNESLGQNKYFLHIRSSFRIPQPQDNLVSLTSMFAVSSGSLGIHLQDIPNQSFRFRV